MLRLPKFELESPTTVAEATRLLKESPSARIIAGGTDILPNMKHGLMEPDVLVSLEAIPELHGITVDPESGELIIGAMTSLATVAADERVQQSAPALAQAAGLVAGPQLRTMGTLGGNVLLDTRCQWYNQTHFWRESLGFCLKKDGTECHVVAGGKKCVAAASNDTVPALMTLGAGVVIHGAEQSRTVDINQLWTADGIWNKKVSPTEILTKIRVPVRGATHRGAYGKLRDRGSIDFPLLGVAVRIDLDSAGLVEDADVVLTALAAKPVRLKQCAAILQGLNPIDSEAWAAATKQVASLASKQCRPMANIPGDHDYRHEMVPVYVRRTLVAAATQTGPVHHI